MTAPDGAATFDVVVVGAGNAGLLAAIEAAERGASVVILQKLPKAGGKSSLAIGSISAAGTSLQRAHGIEADTDDRHWADLLARIEAGGIEPLSMQRLELAVRHGAGAIERLLALGVRFSGPHPELADETWRMHVITPDARALVDILTRRAAELDIEVRTDWSVDGLVVDGDRVVGVRGARGLVAARRYVVLASGDFSAPGRIAAVDPEGSEFAFRPWSSGDGQLMAGAVGAAITDLDRPLRVQLRTMDWPHIEPSPSLFAAGAILVDRRGDRIVNELDQPAAAVAAQIVPTEEPELFVLADSTVLDRIPRAEEDSAHARDAWLRDGGLYIATFPGVGYAYVADAVQAGHAVIGDSLEQVATGLGIDRHGLAQSVARYNADLDVGHPDPLGRVDRAVGVRSAPFFGCGPFRVRAILGRAGLRTDDHVRVLDDEGAPIPGLLAAGAAAGVTGFAYGHGYELAWAVVSGRLAGATAAST